MSKRFVLHVLTPERTFYNDQATCVIVESIDGQIGVLADHIPMVTALSAGMLVIKLDDEVKTAFHSEGFMEVTQDGVDIFCQTCEWPEEIDPDRAVKAVHRARSRLLAQTDPVIMKHSQVALMRAVKRLKVKEDSINH